MSQHGDNRALDLTVGDIYGDMGYPEVIWCSTKFSNNLRLIKIKNKKI